MAKSRFLGRHHPNLRKTSARWGPRRRGDLGMTTYLVLQFESLTRVRLRPDISPAITKETGAKMAESAKTNTPGARILFSLALILSLAAAACHGTNQGENQNQAVRRYHLKGTVVQVDKSQQHLVVDHEEIPGFMGAMTMPYPVAAAATLDQVSPCHQITADLVRTENQIRLENVAVVKKGDGESAPPGAQLRPSEPGAPVAHFAP